MVSTEQNLPTMTRNRPFGIFLIVTGSIAFLAALILFIERLELNNNKDAKLSCDINTWISCGSVMQTPQASAFGFPNIYIGLIGFPIVVAVGILLLVWKKELPRWFWLGFQAGITFAMGFVIWLWYQAVYVISVLCPYCMIVWTMVIPLFIWTTTRNLVHGVIPAPAALTKFMGSWSWILIFLLYLATVMSIVLHFRGLLFS